VLTALQVEEPGRYCERRLFAREREMDEGSKEAPELREDRAAFKKAADHIEEKTAELADAADRRTILATDRTYLASERTYAAWMRTALAALASAVGARALMSDMLPGWAAKLSGSALALFAIFCLVAAVWRQLQGVKPPPHPDIHPIPHTLLIPTNAILGLVAVIVLVGIWAA
jgi:putative membrane protein